MTLKISHLHIGITWPEGGRGKFYILYFYFWSARTGFFTYTEASGADCLFPTTTMQLQPARWDKSKLPASSDNDDDQIDTLSRRSSPSSSPERDANPRLLPPRMRLKEKKSAFEFRLIKQASVAPSHSSSASGDKELVPIPSPPWAKSKPLPQEKQPVEGSQGGSAFLPNHRYPNENTGRYNKTQPSSSPTLPPRIRRPDSPRSRSPPHARSFSPTTTAYRRPSPPLETRSHHPPLRLEAGAPLSPTSSSKTYHTYYRSQSFDYPPYQSQPASPTRHRSYHHLPSLSSTLPSTGQKRRFASDDDCEALEVRGRRMNVDRNGRESMINVDKRRKEDFEREREKASRTLPPLPPYRPGEQRGHRVLSYPTQIPRSGPHTLDQTRNGHYYPTLPPYDARSAGNPPPTQPGEYPEQPSPPFPYPSPLRYPPLPSGSHTYHHPVPAYRKDPAPVAKYPPSYRSPPLGQRSHNNSPYPPQSGSYLPPQAYGPPSAPLQQAPPLLQPPMSQQPRSPSRNGSSARATMSPSAPPHYQLLPLSTPHSYFHKIKLNRPRQSRSSASSQQQPHPQPQAYENQQAESNQQNQTPSQQAAAARHAAYSSPSSVDSTALTTHPVPYSIGVKAASSTASMAGDAGRLVGEYEQHPLRQQTSYLPISAVGGAQFVLKPPRIPKAKLSKMKLMMPAPASTTTLSPPPALASQYLNGVLTNGVADAGDRYGGNEILVEPPRFQPNPEDVLIEIKQEEEESVTASVAAITIADRSDPSGDVVTRADEDKLGTPAVDDAAGEPTNNVGRSTVIIGLCSETNTFAAPARPSRKVKKYPCDVCGQIFTRSGDVNRHKESRHRESTGCICPYCGRVLTRQVDPSLIQSDLCPLFFVSTHRQDALQRHWDKYCRKKAKRMDRRRRFGLSFDPGIDVDPVFLHPTPAVSSIEKREDEASLGGSSGIDVRSFRSIIGADGSKASMFGRRNKGKQKARARVDGDGDVRMLDLGSESEVDELESEDPLDGYDSEDGRRRANREARRVRDEDIDELDESDDDERRDGVKSDAEGVSINGDDFYTFSGSEEEESAGEEDDMDVQLDEAPMMEGNASESHRNIVEELLAPEPSQIPQAAPSAIMPESSSPGPYSPPAAPRLLQSPNHQTPPDSPPANNHVVKDNYNHLQTPIDNIPPLANGHVKQSPSISFVEFRPPAPPPPPVRNIPSKSRPVPVTPTAQTGPAPMSAFTSTFPAQPPHLRQPKSRAEYRIRYDVPVLPPQPPTPPKGHEPPITLGPAPDTSLSVQVEAPSTSSSSTQMTPATMRTRRGPKPRRNDFDAVLDPSQTAAQGGQIRMRVLPQATYMPPVQPALAIMHEQPHVAKRKGKRTDGLVPEYGFVPREYVYRERE